MLSGCKKKNLATERRRPQSLMSSTVVVVVVVVVVALPCPARPCARQPTQPSTDTADRQPGRPSSNCSLPNLPCHPLPDPGSALRTSASSSPLAVTLCTCSALSCPLRRGQWHAGQIIDVVCAMSQGLCMVPRLAWPLANLATCICRPKECLHGILLQLATKGP
ncbi:hypothetical protein IWX90DRAFT_147837 [Phyllosticta citrichinensis]|uniref:Secreted protein n=1 Tax=Phyllosticta citrichinensis TaxID=1130410 RepID=A0ABR1XZ96_9PEZI